MFLKNGGFNVILFHNDASFSFAEYPESTHDPRIGFMIRQNDMGNNSNPYLTVKVNANAAAACWDIQ
ncbi:MAG: hypothetical protein J7623_18550 [Chitinophaga sp.]|uniref:hypothetical protein n=1 Tax=Chitinophaga sp. TaxID=1869181 RepID=UPI001B12FB49|nr:hypothetical protein [Chitinophaga sp.]MBO9730650.1 hypothetical protein [Chitinophaga sp.]